MSSFSTNISQITDVLSYSRSLIRYDVFSASIVRPTAVLQHQKPLCKPEIAVGIQQASAVLPRGILERLRKRRCFADSDLLEASAILASGALVRNNSPQIARAVDDSSAVYRMQPANLGAIAGCSVQLQHQQHNYHQRQQQQVAYRCSVALPYGDVWYPPGTGYDPVTSRILTLTDAAPLGLASDISSAASNAAYVNGTAIDSTCVALMTSRLADGNRSALKRRRTSELADSDWDDDDADGAVSSRRFPASTTSSIDAPRKLSPAVGKPFSVFSVESLLAK